MNVLQEIDEALLYIRKTLSEHPTVRQSCAILDCGWFIPYKQQHVNLNAEGKKVNETPKGFNRYFKGELPEFYGVCWDKVEFLYAPYNVNANHWIALQIDLVNWVVNVFNCNNNLNSDDVIKLQVEPVLKMLPIFMSKYEPLASKYAHRELQQLQFNRVSTIKQNLRG